MISEEPRQQLPKPAIALHHVILSLYLDYRDSVKSKNAIRPILQHHRDPAARRIISHKYLADHDHVGHLLIDLFNEIAVLCHERCALIYFLDDCSVIVRDELNFLTGELQGNTAFLHVDDKPLLHGPPVKYKHKSLDIILLPSRYFRDFSTASSPQEK